MRFIPMKLYKIWSDLPHLGTGGSGRIRWCRNRDSSLLIEDHTIQGFSTLEKWEQEAMTAALGRFFTEEEVDAFQIYIQNSIPWNKVYVEPLNFPIEVSYLHSSEIEYRQQTDWIIIGKPDSLSSFSLDMCGSVMKEADHEPSLWEKPENWIKGETDWYKMKSVEMRDDQHKSSHTEITDMRFEEIVTKWVNLSKEERACFIFRYNDNIPLGNEDVRVIEFLIANATPVESCALPSMIIRLTDKKLALKLLQESLNRIRLEDIEKGETAGDSHYRAMAYLHDPDAIWFLKTRLSAMFEYEGLYGKGHYYSYPGGFVNYFALDFISALMALCRLEPKEENKKLLKGFAFHPNETIAKIADAWWKSISEPE